jgi:hypothetical protein
MSSEIMVVQLANAPELSSAPMRAMQLALSLGGAHNEA